MEEDSSHHASMDLDLMDLSNFQDDILGGSSLHVETPLTAAPSGNGRSTPSHSANYFDDLMVHQHQQQQRQTMSTGASNQEQRDVMANVMAQKQSLKMQHVPQKQFDEDSITATMLDEDETPLTAGMKQSSGASGGKMQAPQYRSKSGGKKKATLHGMSSSQPHQRSRQGVVQAGEPPLKRQKTESSQNQAGEAQGASASSAAQSLGNSGGLRFIHIANDGSVENLKWVLRLKKVYVIQLPNMGNEYISRLIFDKTHKSVIGINVDDQIVGGITYKPFTDLSYIEIAFVAVDGSFQIRGSGRQLMNQLKRVCQEQKLYKFLTYADNQAVGFFQKCGFSTDILISPAKYKGYIKTYNGVTLMECNIAPGIDYAGLTSRIESQKKNLMERMQYVIREGHSHIVYPPLYYDPTSGTPFTDVTRQKRVYSYHDIPGMEKVRSFKPPQLTQEIGLMTENLRHVLEAVKRDDSSDIFREPVQMDILSDYEDFITKHNSFPIDLKMIEKRLNNGFYRNEKMFIADFCRMFENCRLYNAHNPPFPSYANNCEKVFFQSMGKYKLVDKEVLKKYEKRGKRPKKSKSS
uniref:Histone acetyltransferase n=1 Tax=Percolomonas cosmopolitus TaxID=63605 RepID=A0A7S1PHL6_9EUKA|mmetsp:Transcript_2066/g.7451  ORF Transcript_2066/g.7451 Transcript_2066/m.7451 type:complete len:578 (+) Transcript_2066:132-1865(+)